MQWVLSTFRQTSYFDVETSRMKTQTRQFDAWHPGLKSEIPAELLPLVTLFRPENAEIDYTKAKELSDFCGLDPVDLVSLRPERLVQHELLIRVTANLSVPDGPNYEELGINLRSMVAGIFDGHIKPDLTAVDRAYQSTRAAALAFVGRELSEKLHDRARGMPARKENRSFFGRIFGRRPAVNKRIVAPPDPELAAIDLWQAQLAATETALEKACLEGLIKIVGGFVGHRGRLPPDRDLIARLTANYVCSHYSSDEIAAAIEPKVRQAVAERNYVVLPVQERPTVMNVKGASASGKSTIRPLQRRLAGKLGIPWSDFAVISPDYWRKYLLDYGSLGENFKYAAMLTGQELEIINKKLDRYMARKASRGEMSHLLIDRFRFDSFAVESDRSSDSKLLTRFGDRIFMFFMITPPAETVERAWRRGLKTARYKAVDDLLYHNVEAYTGMPGLFFSWARSKEKRVHCEFLDNDVPEGSLPKTAAFGWNNTLTILDAGAMINIDRFRKVNVEATVPGQIFKPEEMAAARNVGFLRRCADQIAEITFADQSSGHVYARMADGKFIWCDRQYIKRQSAQSAVRIALDALGYDGNSSGGEPDVAMKPIDVEKEMHFTVGRWNGN
jgi:hypothetical protein